MWVVKILDPLWPWIFKIKFWNGADWHGTKRMHVDRQSDPLCDFEFWLQPFPWLTFDFVKVKFWGCISRMGRSEWSERDVSWYDAEPTMLPWAMTLTLDFQGQMLRKAVCIPGVRWPIDMERKRCESTGSRAHFVTLTVDLTQDLDLGFLEVKFWKSCISGKVGGDWGGGWVIEMEWKGSESIRCWTHYVTHFQAWIMTLTLDFQGQILKSCIYLEWGGRLTWNDGLWVNTTIESWTHYVPLTFNITHDLGLGFSRLKKIQITTTQKWGRQLTWNERGVRPIRIRCCWTN